MERRFKIDLLDYLLTVSDMGEVRLELLGGVTRKGRAGRTPAESLFWDDPVYEDVDLGVDTFRVLGAVKEFLLEHVYSTRPWQLFFAASSVRKVPIYRWLALRLDRVLGGYILVEEPGGVFSFYRQHVPDVV